MEQPAWVNAMWAELDTHPELDRIVIAGQYITLMTNQLLTELGNHRRILAANAVAREGWDATMVAETIGSTRSVITRLAEDGRRIAKKGNHGPVRPQEA